MGDIAIDATTALAARRRYVEAAAAIKAIVANTHGGNVQRAQAMLDRIQAEEGANCEDVIQAISPMIAGVAVFFLAGLTLGNQTDTAAAARADRLAVLAKVVGSAISSSPG